jgi:hypothetical protein
MLSSTDISLLAALNPWVHHQIVDYPVRHATEMCYHTDDYTS